MGGVPFVVLELLHRMVSIDVRRILEKALDFQGGPYHVTFVPVSFQHDLSKSLGYFTMHPDRDYTFTSRGTLIRGSSVSLSLPDDKQYRIVSYLPQMGRWKKEGKIWRHDRVFIGKEFVMTENLEDTSGAMGGANRSAEQSQWVMVGGHFNQAQLFECLRINEEPSSPTRYYYYDHLSPLYQNQIRRHTG